MQYIKSKTILQNIISNRHLFIMVIEDFLGGAKVLTLEISKASSLIIKIVKLIKQ